jgi:hypothetical protein
MAYSRGTSTNIIVGAAALFVADTTLTPGTMAAFVNGESYKETLADDAAYDNVGYLATAFAEATLENLLLALAGNNDDLSGNKLTSAGRTLNLSAGDIGECPVERAICAVGPGTGDCADSPYIERVYTAYRALSIENVTVSAKRDEASMFEVSFRLLPEDASGSYGKIVDRTWASNSI